MLLYSYSITEIVAFVSTSSALIISASRFIAQTSLGLFDTVKLLCERFYVSIAEIVKDRRV